MKRVASYNHYYFELYHKNIGATVSSQIPKPFTRAWGLQTRGKTLVEQLGEASGKVGAIELHFLSRFV